MTARTGPDARPRGRCLTVGRIAWPAGTALSIGLFAAHLPPYYDRLRYLTGEGG